MNYEFYIAWRFITRSKVQNSMIILGIAFGVAVQFFLLALIGGLQESLIDKTVGTAAHITVLPAERKIFPMTSGVITYRTPLFYRDVEILSWQKYLDALAIYPDVKLATPVVSGGAFIQQAQSRQPVFVRGVWVRDAASFYRFNKTLSAGRSDIAGDQIVIGGKLAQRLSLEVSDAIYIQNDRGSGAYFKISGIINLGNPLDDTLVLMDLERAKRFFSLNGVSSIELQIRDVFAAEKLARQLERRLRGVKYLSWEEQNKELLVALRSQSSSSGLIQFFVVISITLGIASVLGVSAVQKSKQLGILKAIGTDNGKAARIFIYMGLVLGVCGALLGLGLGWGMSVTFIQATNKAGNSFGLQVNAYNLLLPSVLAIFCSGLAAVFPARRAAGIAPVEVIRNA